MLPQLREDRVPAHGVSSTTFYPNYQVAHNRYLKPNPEHLDEHKEIPTRWTFLSKHHRIDLGGYGIWMGYIQIPPKAP